MANTTKFNIGDIVKLKSGGPDMTVARFGSDNGYWCQWFAGKKLEEGKFSEHSLEKAQAS